jgi:hypothetical protein
MQAPEDASNSATDEEALREFLLVLRNALLMVVRYIERRYMKPK